MVLLGQMYVKAFMRPPSSSTMNWDGMDFTIRNMCNPWYIPASIQFYHVVTDGPDVIPFVPYL